MMEFLRRLKRDRFARRMMRMIAAAGGPRDFVYDRADFALRAPENVVFLSNTYEAYCQASGDERKRILDNCVAVSTSNTVQELDSFAAVEDKIVAVVRERAFLAATAGPGWGLGTAADPAKRPADAPFSAWFSKALVVDYPTHVAIVNVEHLTGWNRTFDELYALGLAKLQNSTVPKFRAEEGYYVGAWNDDFDSSRILLPSIFEDLPLNGAPVVVLPNRLNLMVAGADDHAAILAMLAKAEAIVQEQPKPQNPAPLIVREGLVEDFVLGPGHPLFSPVERARKFAALHTYEDQKAHLDRYYQQAGKDFFVASFTLHELKAGGYTSHSVWRKGIATLLPVTDFVMFFDPDQPEPVRLVARVPWSAVAAQLGDLMLDTQMFPPRFFVSKFPAPEQLRALHVGF